MARQIFICRPMGDELGLPAVFYQQKQVNLNGDDPWAGIRGFPAPSFGDRRLLKSKASSGEPNIVKAVCLAFP